jgi:hypothetical protein
MINKLRRYFKRLHVKWKIMSKYKIMKPEGESLQSSSNDSERTCISICRRLISHNDSKFLIAPLSGKRYIKNTSLDLFVILNDRRVSLTNHVYHYDVRLPEREWDRLTTMYDNKTEKIRIDLENQIKSQINYSLTTILDKVNKSFDHQ